MVSHRIFLGSFISHPDLYRLFDLTQIELQNSGNFRWSRRPENLHLTFHFFGTMPFSEIIRLEKNLKPILKTKFEMPLIISGLNFFSRKGKPRILYAEILPQANLDILHQDLQRLLLEHHFIETISNRFTPHITFGRIKNVNESFYEALHLINTGFQPIQISEFQISIIESILTPEGALYEPFKIEN